MNLVDIKRISLRKEATPNRIYIDENGNKYIGTKDKRIEPYSTNNNVDLQIEELTTDITTLNNNVDSLTEDIDTINNELNTLNNELNTKQNTLISGTNIKTINGNSLLGSGNIVISGGGGGGGSSNGYFPSGW